MVTANEIVMERGPLLRRGFIGRATPPPVFVKHDRNLRNRGATGGFTGVMLAKKRVRPASYYREWRARKKAAAAAKLPRQDAPLQPSDPAAAIARWSAERLVVPPGHPREGSPLVLPDFGVAFLADVFLHHTREALLCIARKNAKSAIVAVLLLAFLAGPVRRRGFRAGVVSLNRIKAGELRAQAKQIAEASGLAGLQFLRSPAPGRIESQWGSVDILSSDSDAGAASGFDLAIVDELGLLKPRDRALVNSLRSSVSARDGKFIALTVHGSGPFVGEILARAGDPALAIHHYAAPDGVALDDPAGWRAANPGLGTIKSESYMRDESRRVAVTTSDQASFRALDLNQPHRPDAVLICDPADLVACESDVLPARAGPCYLGLDLGGSVSMSACAAFWPSSGRLEYWCGFGDTPDLPTRGVADGVGALYDQAHTAGELLTFPGRVTPCPQFLGAVHDALQGATVRAIGADRYRRAEALSFYESADIRWPRVWRGVGASATADGSHDVRAFQAAILQRRIVMRPGLMFAAGVACCELRTDAAGNPAIAKCAQNSRIDLISAAVIAVGLAAAARSTSPAARLAVAG